MYTLVSLKYCEWHNTSVNYVVCCVCVKIERHRCFLDDFYPSRAFAIFSHALLPLAFAMKRHKSFYTSSKRSFVNAFKCCASCGSLKFNGIISLSVKKDAFMCVNRIKSVEKTNRQNLHTFMA